MMPIGVKLPNGRTVCESCFYNIRWGAARKFEHKCNGRSGPQSFTDCECEECGKHGSFPEFVSWEDMPQGT